MWTLNGQPAPRDPNSGWLSIDGMQYPPNWPKSDLEGLGLVWNEPPPSVSKALKALADRRWWKSQTFAYDGVNKAPADSALSAVTGFVVAAQIMPPEGPTTWKLAAGELRQWTFEQVVAYGIAIRNHIQACFDREAELTAEILAAEDPSSVDTSQGWPS